MKENNYYEIPFVLNDKIVLTDYSENNGPQDYKLTGIVSMIKMEKAFVTFCMSPVDKQWYYYYDEIVEKKDINYVIQIHNNNNSQYIPYILMYKSNKINNYAK